MLFLRYKVDVHALTSENEDQSFRYFTIMVFVFLVKYNECQGSTLQHSRFASDHNNIIFNNISESKEAACPHWTYHTP